LDFDFVHGFNLLWTPLLWLCPFQPIIIPSDQPKKRSRRCEDILEGAVHLVSECLIGAAQVRAV
jgi:hypothetical protein